MKVPKIPLSYIVASLVILLLLIYLAIVYSPYPQESVELVKKKERILIIAPHSDDETLGTGGVIIRALKKGDKVKVVLMTNGDGFTKAAQINFPKISSKKERYLHLALLRQSESIKALNLLGLSTNNIFFLGYPDGGLDKLWLYNFDKDKPFFNPKIESSYSPYERNYRPKALYTGWDVVQDLTEIIKEFKPTIIYYPHPNDQHPDHWATNAFVKYTLTREKLDKIKENLYLVHRGLWPTSVVIPGNEGLLPPRSLLNTGTIWVKTPLHHDEMEKKKRAILAYQSQIKVMRYFLLSFARPNELFGIYPDAVLAKNKELLLVADPHRDSLNTVKEGDGDITGIYGYSTPSELRIKATLREKVHHPITYKLHLVFLEKEKKTSRMDLVFNENSQKRIMGNKIYFSLPLKSLPSFQYLFINLESRKDGHLLDKTAWRMIKNS